MSYTISFACESIILSEKMIGGFHNHNYNVLVYFVPRDSDTEDMSTLLKTSPALVNLFCVHQDDVDNSSSLCCRLFTL